MNGPQSGNIHSHHTIRPISRPGVWSVYCFDPRLVPPDQPDLCEIIPACFVCGGKMELVYDRPTTKVCVCVECHTSITVPARAWDIARDRGRSR